ncbi:MAG: hypothetical protein J6W81_05785 [Lentisphaeria bacterium]|nr:hypothetical protein [Lentisphaeria bacterium]
MFKKILLATFFCMILLNIAVSCMTLPNIAAPETITVYKNGQTLYVRSSFSAEKDLVFFIYRAANEMAYLIPKSAKITEIAKGERIHASADDYPATNVGGYNFISGNHGSPFLRTLHVAGHGLTEKQIGAEVVSESGIKYYIVGIPNANQILIHHAGSGKTDEPKFHAHSKEKLFLDGKELKFTKSVFTQMYPLNRVYSFSFLVDGKTPLPDQKEVQCEFLDFIFDHDVTDPAAIVKYVRDNPGKKTAPEIVNSWNMLFVHTSGLMKKYQDFVKLPALLSYRNKFRFLPRGAYVLYRTCEVKSPLKNLASLDMMFAWSAGMARRPDHEMYIPKVKKMKLKKYPAAKERIEADFAAVYKIPKQWKVNDRISKGSAIDPQNMPDRFIYLSGKNGKREIGIALGYSLLEGHTALKNKSAERDMAYHFWHTRKMYPYAYLIRKAEPGRVINTIAYKQYFNPQIEPDATVFYSHKEHDAEIVYLDFHKDLTNKTIRLPESMNGKKITVIEQTPSVTLHTKDTVPADGIKLDVKNQYGYIVLKLQ